MADSLLNKVGHRSMASLQVAVGMANGEMCYESPAILWEKLGLKKP
ncbi:MAG: hypothetical protein ACRERS_03655 [Methylococcales bacterium]